MLLSRYLREFDAIRRRNVIKPSFVYTLRARARRVIRSPGKFRFTVRFGRNYITCRRR